MLQLILGQLSPAKIEDDEVGAFQRLKAGDIRFAVFIRHGAKHRGPKSVTFLQFLCQKRHGAFGTVFVIANYKDDVGTFRRGRPKREFGGDERENDTDQDDGLKEMLVHGGWIAVLLVAVVMRLGLDFRNYSL